MKNIVKMLGIIAMIAVIGLAVSCETDPEDQTYITVTGLTDAGNGSWAYIILAEKRVFETGDIIGQASAAKEIAGGEVTNGINEPNGEAFGKNDNYYVFIGIGKTENDAKSSALLGGVFKSDDKVAIKKGPDNTIEMKFFSPSPKSYFGAEDSAKTRLGSFKCSYKQLATSTANTDEFVDLITLTSFSIYEKKDGVKDTANFIDFDISEGWLFADVPASLGTDYTVGFKFTGIIKAGKPVQAAVGNTPKNIYGNKTAPNFDQSDIDNKTEAWMFLYFKADGSFVRTAFSKDGSDKSAEIITDANNANRVYVKQ